MKTWDSEMARLATMTTEQIEEEIKQMPYTQTSYEELRAYLRRLSFIPPISERWRRSIMQRMKRPATIEQLEERLIALKLGGTLGEKIGDTMTLRHGTTDKDGQGCRMAIYENFVVFEAQGIATALARSFVL